MPKDNTTPTRSGIRRLITPWEYRHLRVVASVRLAGGGFSVGVGSVLLSLGRKAETDQERRKCYGWAAVFLGQGALNLFGGCLDMIVDRSARPRT